MPERRGFEASGSAQASQRYYGYTVAHQRETGQYSTDLIDAEWALVTDLFERPAGGRGAPARYERRDLVNACCYVLRTGCAWRLRMGRSARPSAAIVDAQSTRSSPQGGDSGFDTDKKVKGRKRHWWSISWAFCWP
jgi:putative transposase